MGTIWETVTSRCRIFKASVCPRASSWQHTRVRQRVGMLLLRKALAGALPVVGRIPTKAYSSSDPFRTPARPIRTLIGAERAPLFPRIYIADFVANFVESGAGKLRAPLNKPGTFKGALRKSRVPGRE